MISQQMDNSDANTEELQMNSKNLNMENAGSREADNFSEILNFLSDENKRLYEFTEFPAVRNDVLYDRACEENIDEISHCLTVAFANEPKQIALRLTYDEVRSYIEQHVKRAVETENAMVAKDMNSKKILGALTGEDLVNPDPEKAEDYHEKYAPNFIMWDYFKKGYFHFFKSIMKREPKHGEIARVRLAGVNIPLQEAVNRKVGNYLYHFSDVLTYNRGYIGVFGVDSSPISQYLSIKFGYLPLDMISYKDFEFNGKRIFKDIEFKSIVRDSHTISVFKFYDPLLMDRAVRFLKDSWD